jgi:hypothetical protein
MEMSSKVHRGRSKVTKIAGEYFFNQMTEEEFESNS